MSSIDHLLVKMSRWYGFDTREMSRWFGFGSSGDVMMVWFWFLGRCHDGLVSGNSGDVEVA